MIFSRLFFIYIFLPVCLLTYGLARGIKQKNTVLIIFSLIFYAWGEPVYVLLMVLSAIVNYAAGLLIEKYRGGKGDTAATAAAVVFDFLMLGIFKYSGFIAENINTLFSCSIPVPDIKLPIGISFYTFQTVSYVIDCHWGKVRTQKSFKKYLLYLSLFPQLVAGPIVRYSTIEKEIEDRRTTVSDVSYGLNRVALGLAKKVLIANQLSIIVGNTLGNIETSTVVGAWYGAAAYALQIYFDFSGYSDIAIGLGRVFGFHFDENFRSPMISKSISEFWRRWHISLSSWFRDYVYIPLGGNRVSKGRHLLNIMIVWSLTGLWHGASWNFPIWGLYFGLFLLLEIEIGKDRLQKCPAVILHIYTKLVVAFGFGIFYFEDGRKLVTFFKRSVGIGTSEFIGLQDKISLTNNMYLLIATAICTLPIIDLFKKLSQKNFAAKIAVNSAAAVLSAALLLISSIMLVDATTNPFLYFRF